MYVQAWPTERLRGAYGEQPIGSKEQAVSDDFILDIRSVTKRFPGVTALDNVSMQIRRGEIHGLCGENGAGKSTLMKILSGVYPHGTYEGTIIYDGA